MKITFIIPAFNEEKRIVSCLSSLHQAVLGVGRTDFRPEIIVVDNNSTDATAALARGSGVRVVHEPINQIARARNAGAAVATGDWLVFLDADTLVAPGTVVEMLGLIETGGYAGGGTILCYDRSPPFWKTLLWVANHLILPLLRWTPGCFIFCRSDAFRAVGGFDCGFYAGEDVELGKAIRRWGRPKALGLAFLRRHPPVTSIRKIDLYGSREVFTLMVRWLLFPRRTGRDKSRLGIFYDGRR